MSGQPTSSSEQQLTQTSLFGDGIPIESPSKRKPQTKPKAKPKAKKKTTETTPGDAPESEQTPKQKTKPEPRTAPYSVGELTSLIKGTLKADPILGGTILIEGEISNLSPSSRGHVYFQLKDENASIKGVIWASTANKLAFNLEDGMAVTITGTIDIYAPNGTYSLITKRIEPVGIGPLQLAFMQLKEKLSAEGLFDSALKQPVPEFPKRIGIVTAKTGAVIHDMLRVLHRKNPLIDVVLAPVTVQGQGAANSIARAIEQLNDPRLELDTIIVGRGGGSFEDLFCFSEEPVVRAIVASQVPIIAGVGHEPDYSLADAAADLTCSTPTAAAEAVTLELSAVLNTVEFYKEALSDHLIGELQHAEQRFDLASTAFTEGIKRNIERAEQRIELTSQQFTQWGNQLLERPEATLSKLAGELQAYSPLKTLARGYSMAINPISEDVVTSIEHIQAGQPLAIHVKDGHINTVVVSNNPTVSNELTKHPEEGETE